MMPVESAKWPSSVWEGTDSGFLSWAIPFYLRRPGIQPITLDATYGRGTFWKWWPVGQPLMLWAIDLAPKPEVIQMDNRCMGFRSGVFDVVVFDPPHLADSASPRSSHLLSSRYGDAGQGAKVEDLFAPFLQEAFRVLRTDGIVLAKIADMVHNNASRWHHLALMRDAEQAGFWCCDLVVKVRKSAIMGKWLNPHHARKHHAFWLVLRKGKTC